MPYLITITPYNKKEVLWTVALDTAPNKILAQDVLSWASEEAQKAVDKWIADNVTEDMQLVNKQKAAREALGETQWLVDQAEREAKQYARLHAGYGKSINYTPPTA